MGLELALFDLFVRDAVQHIEQDDHCDRLVNLRIFFLIGKYKLCRAHDIGSAVLKITARPFGLGGEGGKASA